MASAETYALLSRLQEPTLSATLLWMCCNQRRVEVLPEPHAAGGMLSGVNQRLHEQLNGGSLHGAALGVTAQPAEGQQQQQQQEESLLDLPTMAPAHQELSRGAQPPQPLVASSSGLLHKASAGLPAAGRAHRSSVMFAGDSPADLEAAQRAEAGASDPGAAPAAAAMEAAALPGAAVAGPGAPGAAPSSTEEPLSAGDADVLAAGAGMAAISLLDANAASLSPAARAKPRTPDVAAPAALDSGASASSDEETSDAEARASEAAAGAGAAEEAATLQQAEGAAADDDDGVTAAEGVAAAAAGIAAAAAAVAAGSVVAAGGEHSGAADVAVAAERPPRHAVVFAYASQTGTAAEIARNLHAEALQRKIDAQLLSLDDLGFDGLAPLAGAPPPLLILIASSTGDGEAPDNAAGTYAALRQRQEQQQASGQEGALCGLRFTLLGLGSSDFSTFMNVPRSLKAGFEGLGAELFYQYAEADEEKGTDKVAEPWAEGLWEPLVKAVAVNAAVTGGVAAAAASAASGQAAAAAATAAEAEAGPEPVVSASEEVRLEAAAAAAAAAAPDSAEAEAGSALAALTAAAEAAAAGVSDPTAQAALPVMPGEAELSGSRASEEQGQGQGEQGPLSPAASASSPSALKIPALALTRLSGAAGSGQLKSSLRRQSVDPSGGPQRGGGSPAAGGKGSPRHGPQFEAALLIAEESMRGSLRRQSQDRAAAPGSPRGSVGGATPRSFRGGPGPDGELATSGRRSLLSHKPSSAMFPKREEATVPRKDEQSYGLNLGKAPVGSDLKGAPAPSPCRIKVSWDRNADNMAMTKSLEASRPSPSDLAYRDPEGTYASKPYWAEVSNAWYETAYWSDRKVLALELDVGDSGMAYEAGDALAIMPVNPPELVANLIKKLKLSPDDVFNVRSLDGSKNALPHLPCPCTVLHALSRCVDITSTPKKSLLRTLAEHCSEATDKRTLTFFTSKAGQDAYQHEIVEHQPSLLDFLNRFTSCTPSFDVLLDALSPLAPRCYTVTTSPAAGEGKVQVALSVVRFKTRYGHRAGVASTWLDRMVQPMTGAGGADSSAHTGPIRVPVLLRKSATFTPPTDLAQPVIMIGPGTGVAPFRGFLQKRQALIKQAYPEGLPADKLPDGLAQAWLFSGCRREDEDCLFKDELDAFVADRTLTQFKVAYSRAKAEKVYVQDLIKQDAEEVGALLDVGATVFLCGDGAAMARDVHAALLAVVKARGGLTDDAAASKLERMVQERRYVRDIWLSDELAH